MLSQSGATAAFSGRQMLLLLSTASEAKTTFFLSPFSPMGRGRRRRRRKRKRRKRRTRTRTRRRKADASHVKDKKEPKTVRRSIFFLLLS
jgi:hypothetical protein